METSHLVKSLKECILKQVGGVIRISGIAPADRMEPGCIPEVQLLLGLRVTFRTQGSEIPLRFVQLKALTYNKRGKTQNTFPREEKT
jgi:hypothetical protein